MSTMYKKILFINLSIVFTVVAGMHAALFDHALACQYQAMPQCNIRLTCEHTPTKSPPLLLACTNAFWPRRVWARSLQRHSVCSFHDPPTHCAPEHSLLRLCRCTPNTYTSNTWQICARWHTIHTVTQAYETHTLVRNHRIGIYTQTQLLHIYGTFCLRKCLLVLWLEAPSNSTTPSAHDSDFVSTSPTHRNLVWAEMEDHFYEVSQRLLFLARPPVFWRRWWRSSLTCCRDDQ